MEAARILVGITGGIAAYKVPQLIRQLKKSGVEVKSLRTPYALRFVGDETLRTVTGYPVYRDGAEFYDIEHIRLAEWTDLFAICPATANTIAKIAHGIADNLLTTTALSLPPEKIVIAPAMNTVMWLNAATQENIALLARRGFTVLPVGEGELACSTTGPGRMLEIEEIASRLLARVHSVAGPTATGSTLAGKHVLISSGPTEEPIDPVRVITNRSSGKMGAALAEAALRLGAKVTVVSGPARVAPPTEARVVAVRTASQMREALLAEFPAADICIMAAAVSDFRPARVSAQKIRRKEHERLTLELESNPDILAELGSRKGPRLLVGFALETGDGEASARRKMAQKSCDLMILNGAEESLEGASTRITIFTPGGPAESLPGMSKAEAAEVIMQRIASLSA